MSTVSPVQTSTENGSCWLEVVSELYSVLPHAYIALAIHKSPHKMDEGDTVLEIQLYSGLQSAKVTHSLVV
jgi:hypothetical protein